MGTWSNVMNMFSGRKNQGNVFHGSKRDIWCDNINKLDKNRCYFERTNDGTMLRHYNKNIKSYWEIDMYLCFLRYDYATLVLSQSDSHVAFDTRRLVPVVEFLQGLRTDGEKKCFIQELFTFVSRLYERKLVHGNLHGYNILVDPSVFYKKGRFFLIDFMNSYDLKSTWFTPVYSRTSFLGEGEGKTNIKDHMMHWDIFTLYVSLKQQLCNDTCNLLCLEDVVRLHVPDTVLKDMLDKYIVYNSMSVFK
jgi:hypothetical protein